MNAKIMVTTYFVCKKLNINRLGKHGNYDPMMLTTLLIVKS